MDGTSGRWAAAVPPLDVKTRNRVSCNDLGGIFVRIKVTVIQKGSCGNPDFGCLISVAPALQQRTNPRFGGCRMDKEGGRVADSWTSKKIYDPKSKSSRSHWRPSGRPSCEVCNSRNARCLSSTKACNWHISRPSPRPKIMPRGTWAGLDSLVMVASTSMFHFLIQILKLQRKAQVRATSIDFSNHARNEDLRRRLHHSEKSRNTSLYPLRTHCC